MDEYLKHNECAQCLETKEVTILFGDKYFCPSCLRKHIESTIKETLQLQVNFSKTLAVHWDENKTVGEDKIKLFKEAHDTVMQEAANTITDLQTENGRLEDEIAKLKKGT